MREVLEPGQIGVAGDAGPTRPGVDRRGEGFGIDEDGASVGGFERLVGVADETGLGGILGGRGRAREERGQGPSGRRDRESGDAPPPFPAAHGLAYLPGTGCLTMSQPLAKSKATPWALWWHLAQWASMAPGPG